MNPKKQSYIISLILILIIASIVVGVIYPLVKEIKKSYSEIISQKKELLLLKIMAENLIGFQKQYLVFYKSLDEIDQVFIDPETPIDFLQFLENTANNIHLPIEISIGAPKEKKLDIWPSLSFQIITKGNADKIFRFIDKIENSPYLTEFEGLNITRLDQDDIKSKEFEGLSAGDLKISLLAKVYAK